MGGGEAGGAPPAGGRELTVCSMMSPRSLETGHGKGVSSMEISKCYKAGLMLSSPQEPIYQHT